MTKISFNKKTFYGKKIFLLTKKFSPFFLAEHFYPPGGETSCETGETGGKTSGETGPSLTNSPTMNSRVDCKKPKTHFLLKL